MQESDAWVTLRQRTFEPGSQSDRPELAKAGELLAKNRLPQARQRRSMGPLACPHNSNREHRLEPLCVQFYTDNLGQ